MIKKKRNSHLSTRNCGNEQLSRTGEGRTTSRRRDSLLLIPQVTVGGTALSVTNPWLSLSGFFFFFSFRGFFFFFFLFKWKFRPYVNL